MICKCALLTNAQIKLQPVTFYENSNIVGLNITEVSHDTVIGIKNDLTRRGISNSFDTWHGKRTYYWKMATFGYRNDVYFQN